MNNDELMPASGRRYSPLFQLLATRLREFYREPEALFWVYGFPIFMVVILGIAFRSKPVEQINVDVEDGSGAARVVEALKRDAKFQVEIHDTETCRMRWRAGKTDVVVIALGEPGPQGSVPG